ncbi:precorrin-6y C5,15-methyltransferase (decarboxylating) subunit CbiE [Tsukamurella serpentis]
MTVTVVGIGADGWSGLSDDARAELIAATVIHGSARQLALLPPEVTAQRRQWPSPLLPALDGLGSGVHLLASGDPMFYGIGATLAARRPDLPLRVIPHLSCYALACARMTWPAHEVTVVSAVARDPAPLVRVVRAGGRALVLSESGATPAAVRNLITDAGLAAELTVLETLGGPRERVRRYESGMDVDDLNVVAVAPLSTATAGGGDSGTRPAEVEFDHDGQITKDDIRALTVAALAPSRGWIWDLGAGSGSVGITWALAGGGRVLAVERRPDRAERVARNAARAGVHVELVVGDSGAEPDAIGAGFPPPDAVFIGGGLTAPLARACVDRLPAGGALVANTVTVEGQSLAAELHRGFGGELRSYTVADLRPLGAGTAWQPRRPIVQWVYRKEQP